MRYLDIFTPDSIIAAAVPYGSEDPREAAYNNAAYALDRDDVHLIASIENKKVFYIAAASEDFASHMNAVTPLAAGLPGMKGHQGDGAYIAISESGYAVVVRKGDELFSYVGDRQSVDAFIASHDVPTYSSNDAAAVPWEGFRTGIVRRAQAMARNTIFLGAFICIIALMAWMGFASIGNNMSEEAEKIAEDNLQEVSQSVEKLKAFTSQPVIKDIYRMNDIIGKATNYGGVISYFKLEKGEVTWKVEMPTYTPNKYLEQMGKDYTVTKDDQRNVLIVELPSKLKP